jgi:alcohol dehydrogenase (cytochrome c)
MAIRALGLALPAAGPCLAQSPAVSAAGDFSPQRLTELPRSGWPTNGGNLYNQRYSPLTEINADNIDRLGAIWRTRLRGSGVGSQFSASAQPLVAN